MRRRDTIPHESASRHLVKSSFVASCQSIFATRTYLKVRAKCSAFEMAMHSSTGLFAFRSARSTSAQDQAARFYGGVQRRKFLEGGIEVGPGRQRIGGDPKEFAQASLLYSCFDAEENRC